MVLIVLSCEIIDLISQETYPPEAVIMNDNNTPTHNPTDTVSSSKSSSEFVKRYVGIISLASTVLIIAIFWGFNTKNTTLIRHQLEHEARAFFKEIVQTRHWIISQEGVYVKKKPGMRVDPMLDRIPGLKTSITDKSGATYLLRNHAAVTQMISDLATEDRQFGLHITSLDPLNPLNVPDSFEREALKKFETGSTEISTFIKTPSGVLYRYIAPLTTQKECLRCHSHQGYELGDIRGGISISIPADHITQEIKNTLLYTIISAIAVLALLLSVIIYISLHFIKDLDRSEQKLVELATTDSLTSLLNRREGIRRFQQEISHSIRAKTSMSVIIIDIDLFKKINDNYGHVAGDQAIKLVSSILVKTLRNYDVICRYGGEEFLIVLPTTDLKKAVETAERLRKALESKPINTEGASFNLTISLGVSALKHGDSLDGLVYRADNALYIAKQEGRNQVQFID